MHNPEDRARAELQSTEFGIVPDQLFCRKHPGKKESIGSWGDSGDALLTRDRLRESYGVGDGGSINNFSTPTLTKWQPGGGILEEEALINNNSSLGSTIGANPFD